MMKKDEEIEIIMKDSKKTTRKELFKKKELFHKQLAKIPFEQKIRMLIRLQGIADSIKKKQRAWKIFPKSPDEGVEEKSDRRD